ncbi:SDR family oxidoreductase [Aeromicrobium sp. Marseille-Q0843]|uniref:SDR family oxidoreductase n=1 Tax=Aeromicrobium phoceense TaxID=2754045 RepID=A0A838XGW6_9ACTN|nr:SDR family oxidoreductase [Aeromicrobium phoceense]MBA4608008.1 SDR family oxidoreductase [Aeromicrobium phoceense]
MDINGKVAVVTGAGGGIGAALADALVAGGARVVLADLKADGVESVAARLNEATPGSAVAVAGDVSRTDQIEKLVAAAEESFGPVDIYFANAGVGGGVDLDASEEDWDLAHQVNVMAHVRAARLLVPGWVERGQGYFVSTASAAGLLTQIGSATYSVSKHGAVAFAEWLSITYGDQGVAVSCLCPMGVNTDMLTGGAPITNETQRRAAQAVTDAGGVLEADEVAAIVLRAMEAEQFLILPHPEVAVFQSRKTGDIDRWLAGMRRYQASLA